MRHNAVETLVGAVVLLIAAGFAWFAITVADMRAGNGYELNARFERIDGLAVGSEVRLSGIKVGTVSAVTLDPKTYFALVRFRIQSGISVPTDTVAEVASEGLLGGRFVNLLPGAADSVLAADGTIRFTQAPVDLIQMLGKFMFSAAEERGRQGEGAPPPPPPPPAYPKP